MTQKLEKLSEADIKTHRELAQTGCPGRYLQDEIVKAREAGKFKIDKTSGILSEIDKYVKMAEDYIRPFIEKHFGEGKK